MKKEAQNQKQLEFKTVKEKFANSKIKFVVIKNPPQWHRYKKYERV